MAIEGQSRDDQGTLHALIVSELRRLVVHALIASNLRRLVVHAFIVSVLFSQIDGTGSEISSFYQNQVSNLSHNLGPSFFKKCYGLSVYLILVQWNYRILWALHFSHFCDVTDVDVFSN